MKRILLLFVFLPFMGMAQQCVCGSMYNMFLKEKYMHNVFVKSFPMNQHQFITICEKAYERLKEDSSVYHQPYLDKVEWNVFVTILNTAFVDTTRWISNELIHCVLVSDTKKVSRRDALQRFAPKNRQEVRRFKWMIDQYNKKSMNRNDTYVLSRPLFDSTCNYAMIEEIRGEDAWGWFFYKWKDSKWVEVVSIATRL